MRRGRCQEPATWLHSKPWRKKEKRSTEIEKDKKKPEAKDNWDNLRQEKLARNKPH